MVQIEVNEKEKNKDFNTDLKDPEILKKLKIISEEIRLDILLLLNKNGKLNFNDIAQKLKINRSKLAYHIAILKNSNIIVNEKLVDKKKGKSFSFYSISKKGKELLLKFTK